MPGQPTPLHLVQADEGDLRHRVRKSQRYWAFRELERRRPGTFGGLNGAVHRQACWDGLQVATTEGDRSILRGLLAGATWTAGRAAGHAILRSDRRPFCCGAPQMEPHILWDCPRWESARRAWMPWVLQEAMALPAQALLAAWPVCLRAIGLLPLALVGEGEDAQVGWLLYRLYGMYLAVLSARPRQRRRLGCGETRPPRCLARHGVGARIRDRGTGWSSWRMALHSAPAGDPLQLPPGPLVWWPWERSFAETPVRWASALQWVLGLGRVTYAELALDFESHSNRALPARPGHRHAPASAVTEGAGTRAAGGGRPAAAPARRETSGGCALFWCPWGGFRSTGQTKRPVFVAAPAALPGALDAPAVDPEARPQGLFLGRVLAAPPRGGGGAARPYEIVRA